MSYKYIFYFETALGGLGGYKNKWISLYQPGPSIYWWSLIQPHVRDYPNQEYKAELCYKAPLCTPEAFDSPQPGGARGGGV